MIGAETLRHGECLRLLGSVSLGRVVYTDNAMPAIRPVNFLLREGVVVFRVGEDQQMATAIKGAVVAFQADRFAADLTVGWTVRVIGRATEIRDRSECAQLADLGLRGWSPADARYIAVEVELAIGERIAVT
ncbi:pyridoxamine 5'-phosphate oxidase family protein [Amycolatopsis nigrescens]|uniref:pyridoxamine 5'-phosphate oxidase family protein n=1 Tax=Amycolatopsis nigrescens TaxID=381445 RepID=UPI0003625A34|nr:pyridoxamine 5'-phosphate oxidase family protein [Amycolatopsis nigrescens]